MSKKQPKTLILLRGIPGAGKTTLAKFLVEMMGSKASVCHSADDYMFKGGKKYDRERLTEVHTKCEIAVENSMKKKFPVVILHNTMTREWEFEHYLMLANKYKYRVVSLIVEHRHHRRSIHSTVTDEIAHRFEDRFEIKLIGDAYGL